MSDNNIIIQNCDDCCCRCIQSKILSSCEGENIKTKGINGSLVAKAPVILGEKEVNINLKVNIGLQQNCYEIKADKKNVYLTESILLPTAGKIENGVLKSGKLFLEGYIRENIQYSTVECINKYETINCSHGNIVSGDIKYTTIDIPFNCVTEIQYLVQPQVSPKKYDTNNNLNTIEYVNSCMDNSNYHESFRNTIFYVDKPYCEVSQAKIIESDSCKKLCITNTQSKYKKIEKKISLSLMVTVLQVQQVNILGLSNNTIC
ncbi:hypothetical protein FDJ70_01935 [Clostridium botulinum]|uniref:DUF7852 domain-containing protein n=1 Tax=Clostridium botulinum D str. 1873 TaxID=592027 RepID=A0A9P2G6R7_CLOBO|nr:MULTISPECIES: hypothetical protein [Clostridium]EES91017.1 conserved hypothetical protein [Clostridium botulinum D str. 1873]MBO3442050.1 hypothetical protein [Clostridium haemolyticum]NFV46449.1 hypothetical protein [Clostridium botulinum]